MNKLIRIRAFYLLLVSLITIFMPVPGQAEVSDSLKAELLKTQDPVEKSSILLRLFDVQRRVDPQESLQFLNTMDSLLEIIEVDTLRILYYLKSSDIQRDLGNYTEALEFINAGMEYYRQSQLTDKRKRWHRELLLSKGSCFDYLGQIDSCAATYKQVIRLLQQSEKKSDEQEAYTRLGNAFYYAGMYDSSIFYLKIAKNLALEMHDLEREADVNLNLSNSIYEKGDIPSALEAYFFSERIYDSLDIRWKQAIALQNIVNILVDEKEFEKALRYIEQVLEIARDNNNLRTIAYMTNRKANVFDYQHRFEEALKLYEQSLEFMKKSNDLRGQASVLNNIGVNYSDQGKRDLAIGYFKKSLKIKESIGNIAGVINSNNNISTEYNYLDKGDLALKYALKALKLADSIDQFRVKPDIYANIANAHASMGNFKAAFEYKNKYEVAKDSLMSLERQEVLAEMEAKYETEKKELENRQLKTQSKLKDISIAKQKAEIEHEKEQQQRLYVIIVLMCSFLGVLVYGIRKISNQKKIVDLQNEDLSQKNEEILTQRDQIEEQRNILAEQKHEIVSSINYAQRIQNAILANKDTWDAIGEDRMILYKPRDIVSGDFYWAYSDDQFAIWVAADCTGHGVPGAFMSMLGMGFLHQIVSENQIFEPDQILNHLRSKIIGSLEQKYAESQQKDGMDMAVCRLEKKTNILHFSGANNPLYILRAGEIQVIRADRMPVGKYIDEKTKDFTPNEVVLEAGDRLITFSDGFNDQFGGENDKKYGSKRFKSFLLEKSSQNMEELHDVMNSEIINWIGKGKQLDDICVVVVKVGNG